MAESIPAVVKPFLFCALLLSLVLCTGCNMNAKVTVFLSADKDTAEEEAAADKANVEIDEIASLTVTVNSVALDRTDGSQAELIVTPQDVDLIDLAAISTLLTAAEVPAGTYTKIRLGIENPRLVLKSDPETVVTDIQLTANSQLFVGTRFAVPPDANTNIVLTLGGIHLVEQGNGGYTLTPQLRAEIAVDLVPMSNEGTIVSVDAEAETLVLDLGNGEVTVDFSEATIYLPGDTGTPTGTPEDLVAGGVVMVEGTVDADGVIVASTLTIQAGTPAV